AGVLGVFRAALGSWAALSPVGACEAAAGGRRQSTEAFQFAAVALGGATRAPVAEAGRSHRLAGRRGRTVGDIALDGHGGAHPLADQALHHDDPLAALMAQTHLVADAYGVGGLHPLAVDPHMAAPASRAADRPGLDEPHGPDPAVDAHALTA